MKVRVGIFVAVGLLVLIFAAAVASAQDIEPGLTYTCNGERIYIDSCNMQDTSDTSRCFIGHPDTIMPNGLMKYTYMTRGDMKKLLPTCKPPTPEELAKIRGFNQKVADKQAAAQKKAEDDLNAKVAQQDAQLEALAHGNTKPQTPEERAIARCITSGRLAASCTGNALLGAFTQMVSQVLPAAGKEAAAGPNMAGVFQGAGGWRLDFIDDGVLVNCSYLAPDQHSYKLEFKNDHLALVIDTTPKPLVLTVHADGTIEGPGPFTIDGVVAAGYSSDTGSGFSHNYHDEKGTLLTDSQAANRSNVYDSAGNRVPNAMATSGHTNFAHKTVTCPALNLSSKGAGVGIQTMETDLLKTAFGGDKGPPTPPGIRMRGIYAAASGFSVQFFPESAVLGCGPDAARAYPYTVAADGTRAVIRIAAPDHPLALAYRPDGSLDPGGTGQYQVHGRRITGQNDDGDFTFAPMEQMCSLAVLTASDKIPASSGASMSAAAGPAANGGGAAPATAGAAVNPSGAAATAVLTIASEFSVPAGVQNPVAGKMFVLLRDSFDNVLANGGFATPAGTSPYVAMIRACTNRTPDCQKASDAVNGAAAIGGRLDATGTAKFAAVAPGTYWIMGAGVLGAANPADRKMLFWNMRVALRPGANSVVLDPSNATVLRP
jgi:hypothetical protein